MREPDAGLEEGKGQARDVGHIYRRNVGSRPHGVMSGEGTEAARAML